MKLSRYLEVRKEVLAHAEEVGNKKRHSYTAGDTNVLRNFLSDAEFVGNNQLQNCLTHTMKQVRGIASFVQHPDVEPSETLLSRAADLINYAVLLVANAEDMGRDTGLETQSYLNPLFDPRYGFKEPDPPTTIVDPVMFDGFKFVPMLESDATYTKVLNDFYTHTFGSSKTEEPWKD